MHLDTALLSINNVEYIYNEGTGTIKVFLLLEVYIFVENWSMAFVEVVYQKGLVKYNPVSILAANIKIVQCCEMSVLFHAICFFLFF